MCKPCVGCIPTKMVKYLNLKSPATSHTFWGTSAALLVSIGVYALGLKLQEVVAKSYHKYSLQKAVKTMWDDVDSNLSNNKLVAV